MVDTFCILAAGVADSMWHLLTHAHHAELAGVHQQPSPESSAYHSLVAALTLLSKKDMLVYLLYMSGNSTFLDMEVWQMLQLLQAQVAAAGEATGWAEPWSVTKSRVQPAIHRVATCKSDGGSNKSIPGTSIGNRGKLCTLFCPYFVYIYARFHRSLYRRECNQLSVEYAF
jgi:hypothetical protein